MTHGAGGSQRARWGGVVSARPGAAQVCGDETAGGPSGRWRPGGLDARTWQGARLVRPGVGAETAGPHAPCGTPGDLIVHARSARSAVSTPPHGARGTHRRPAR